MGDHRAEVKGLLVLLGADFHKQLKLFSVAEDTTMSNIARRALAKEIRRTSIQAPDEDAIAPGRQSGGQ